LKLTLSKILDFDIKKRINFDELNKILENIDNFKNDEYSLEN